MTLNDAYLLSQIVAVVLVAPSILYLALQVRQNTQQLRATARFQWVEASGQFNALTAGSVQVASMFRKGWDNPDQLDDDERMQFLIHLGHFLQVYSTMYELHQEKLLPETQWYNCRKDMISVMNSPGGLWVWEAFGRKGLHPEFVTFMEGLRKAEDGSFDLTADGMKREAVT
ncbi:hypothetical protein [Henriciella pelagia]|uniref:DUF4760 domain-containing protein n=1 Tax=Henriciella pelagia TaxID=1977912 RepID=A0ABQ1JWC2_9PROT|nr:hypothetical protein [Henriciella pelagia]GGB78698.1 hypothetical protein GCM10011503_29420 [Henriciella pelagia]